jgi:hypothetical protein
MSLELVNTFATLGTFLVIAATAIAAIVPVRHMRGSNQIVALNELRETTETAGFRAAQLFPDRAVFEVARPTARPPPRRSAAAEVAFEIVAWVVRWAEPASLAGGLVGRT